MRTHGLLTAELQVLERLEKGPATLSELIASARFLGEGLAAVHQLGTYAFIEAERKLTPEDISRRVFRQHMEEVNPDMRGEAVQDTFILSARGRMYVQLMRAEKLHIIDAEHFLANPEIQPAHVL